MIFEKRKVVCPLEKDGEHYVMLNAVGKEKIKLPIGEAVKIIAFTKSKKQKRQFIEKSVIIGDKNQYSLVLSEMSEKDFKVLLKNYGFVESCCKYSAQAE